MIIKLLSKSIIIAMALAISLIVISSDSEGGDSSIGGGDHLQ